MTLNALGNPDRLTFRKGKFIFEEASDSRLRAKLRNDANWGALENDSFETTSLGSARVLKKYADAKVRKIFRRTFQEFYTFPNGRDLLDLPLDHHQRVGIEWVLTRKRSYLAHAPGAGKTIQAILAAVLSEGEGPTLFIVPPSLLKNWEREFYGTGRFLSSFGFPSLRVISVGEPLTTTSPPADFYLVSDSLITKPKVHAFLLNLKPKFIAVDEASRFKEPTAKRSLAFYGGRIESTYYRALFREARHTVFLDGSPMPNRPIELWAPAYALNPESIDCLSYDDFGYRYCGAKPNERGVWEYLYSSNEEELRTKLRKDFMHVVPESELSHPERRRKMVYLDKCSNPELRTWESRNINRSEFSEDTCRGELARVRRELGLSKVPLIARYVKERAGKNESILLFVWHREVAYLLGEKLTEFKPHIIIGKVPIKDRIGSFEKFQTGELKLLIMNISAAGRGLNLQRADRVIFGEYSWTDETNKQAEKRASRKGSDKLFVPCDYLVSSDSIDEVVLRSLFTKEKRVKKVVG